MSQEARLFTSESVSEGHPDKVCDQISDAVLDAIYETDPNGRVACETMTSRGLVVMAGEITTTADIDYQEVARKVIEEIGYNDPALGFDANSCAVFSAMGKQSVDIALGVDAQTSQSHEQGAGDQGMMFGYACRETDELMPFPIHYSHRILEELAKVRKGGVEFLRPDSKSQLTVEYDENHKPVRITTVVISHQHSPEVADQELKATLREVCEHVLPTEFLDAETKWWLNPTGRFVEGGPKADAGLTGRKIIVDTYGGMGRHGGGAFSGKDPSKVDRSAAYASRWVAKNVVAAGLAERCEVQVAYAIGVAEPVSIRCDTFGTGQLDDRRLDGIVRKVFDLRPAGIIEALDLRRPIYRRTAAYGHFGRPEFSWERIDRVEDLRAEAGS
ncbi:MAG: methionine adenosyltransferase [Planctomycetota bacterium]|jgi:S-adenosylmethionine synthetase|nr:methionine adenosyltransferase [Planctomycetota bacterium]